MAIKKIGKEWSSSAEEYIYTFVMDSDSDFASLPKSGVGSTAIVADKDGPIYMVNASGEWKEV
jgi:hypothetical protein